MGQYPAPFGGREKLGGASKSFWFLTEARRHGGVIWTVPPHGGDLRTDRRISEFLKLPSKPNGPGDKIAVVRFQHQRVIEMATRLKDRSSLFVRILVCVISLSVGLTLGLTNHAIGLASCIVCLIGATFFGSSPVSVGK
jgi:hypothetical protein